MSAKLKVLLFITAIIVILILPDALGWMPGSAESPWYTNPFYLIGIGYLVWKWIDYFRNPE